MMIVNLCLVLLLIVLGGTTHAFVVLPSATTTSVPWRTTTTRPSTSCTITTRPLTTRPPPFPLFAAGGGFGGGVTKKKKTNNKKKKGKKSKQNNNNNGSSFDLKASFVRHEKRYIELGRLDSKTYAKEERMAAAFAEKQQPEDNSSSDDDKPMEGGECFTNDDLLFQEYICAIRCKKRDNTTTAPLSLQDWIPVAQVGLARGYHTAMGNKEQFVDTIHDPAIVMAVSTLVREILFAAGMASPMYKTTLQTTSDLEFSMETFDSFEKYVYGNIMEGGPTAEERRDNPEQFMTKEEAMEILQVEASDLETATQQLKSAYRKKSFQYHPDRRVVQQQTDEESAESTKEYHRVKNAYETLIKMGYGRDSGRSWYQSLGGKERAEYFLGPIDLKPLAEAREYLKENGVEASMCGLQPELVQNFIFRSHSMAAQDASNSNKKRP